MTSVHHDTALADDDRRKALYAGDIFLTSPGVAALEFCAFARDLAEAAFPGLDPEHAQHEMTVAAYVAVLADLKPRFIHHPRSKELLRDVLQEQGCDLETHLLRRPSLADLDEWRLPDLWSGLCVASSS